MNCRTPAAAEGYFLDRLNEAVSVPEVAANCNELVQLLSTRNLPEDIQKWEDYGQSSSHSAVADKVGFTYERAKSHLKKCTNVKVLIVLDEVNAFWENSNSVSYFNRSPWNMANFRVPFLQNGALLVSGTTDSNFVATIPSGVEHKAIYYVGEMDDEHVSSMMETDLGSPLKELQTFDPICYNKVIAASGKIPRELQLFAEHLEPISTRAKRARESPESISQTDDYNKKLKKDFEDCISEHFEIRKSFHRDYLEAVIKQDQKDGVKVFASLLFDWCKAHFLEGRKFGVFAEVLRVPNFIVSPHGGAMRSTMPWAS